MSEEQFRQLCNTYGFAPSRALREMIDCATARAEAQRDALLEALKMGRLMLIAHGETHAKINAAIAKAEENT